MFGTFVAPTPGEPLTYGLTRPLRTWSFPAVNFGLYAALVRDAWKAPSLRAAFSVLFSRTASGPQGNADELGVDVDPAPVSRGVGLYALVQVLALLVVNIPLVADDAPRPPWFAPALFAAMAGSAWVVSGLLTAGRQALAFELARLSAIAIGLVELDSPFAMPAVLWAVASAVALMAAVTARRGTAAESASSTAGRPG